MPRHRRHFPPDTASQYYIVLCTKVFCQYTFHCPETTHNNLLLKLPLSLHFHQTYFILILTLITIHHSAPRQPKSKAIPLSPCTERTSVSYKDQNTVVSFLCQTACQTGSFHSLAHNLSDRLFPFFCKIKTPSARPGYLPCPLKGKHFNMLFCYYRVMSTLVVPAAASTVLPATVILKLLSVAV